jgi:hypothetical protein
MIQEKTQRIVTDLKRVRVVHFDYSYDDGAPIDYSCTLSYQDQKFRLIGAETLMHGYETLLGEWENELKFAQYLEEDQIIVKLIREAVRIYASH